MKTIWLALLLLPFPFLIWRSLGVSLIRGIQRVDSAIGKVLQPVAWLPGANWRPKTGSRRDNNLRRAWFLLFFLAISIGAILLPVASWPPMLTWRLFGISIGLLLRAFVISLGLLAALAVAWTWMAAVADMLEDEEDHGEAFASQHYQRMAVLSIYILVALVPFAFQTIHEMNANQFDGVVAEVNSEADDVSSWRKPIFRELRAYGEWALFTADLGLGVAMEFLPNSPNISAIRPKGVLANCVVTLFLLVMTSVVIKGVILVARCDHALDASVQRLKRTGKTVQVVKFGTRALPKLVEILQKGTIPEITAAAKAIGEIYTDSSLHWKRAYRELCNRLNDKRWEVREASARALGAMGRAGTEHELFPVLESDPQISIRIAAATALGQIAAESYQEKLSDHLSHKMQQSPGVRASVAEALGNLPKPKAKNSRVYSALWDRFIHDDSSWVRLRAAQTLKALGDSRIQDGVGGLLSQLQEGRAASDRKAAAKELAVSLEDSTVARGLIQRVSEEQDAPVRAEIVRSLANAYRLPVGGGTLEKVAKLHRRLLSEDDIRDVRKASAEALGEAPKDAANIRVLANRMDPKKEPSKTVRKACVRALERHNALDALAMSIDPQDAALAKTVAAAIRNLRGRSLLTHIGAYRDKLREASPGRASEFISTENRSAPPAVDGSAI